VTYFYMACLVMIGTFPEFGAVRPAAAVVGLMTCGVAGVVSHRRIVTEGDRARLGVLAIAVVAATVLTLLNRFVRAPLTSDGEPVFGFGASLLLLSFFGGFYWASLGPGRWLAPAAVAANVGLGLLVFPAPSAVTARALAASVLWNLFPYFPCRHLGRALEGAGARHARYVETVDEGAEHAAFVEGRESVVGLVRQAREDALRQLDVLAPRLDPRIAELASHRLKEVEQRLKAIESEPESSSSTTTS
jgi:hypothetical protein